MMSGIDECVFCHGETKALPLVCVCPQGNHPVCMKCLREYWGMFDAVGLKVCPLSKEFKTAQELMGEAEEPDLAAFFRLSRKAVRKWRKENPY